MKRTLSVIDLLQETSREHKKQRYTDKYISPSELYNYMNNDSLVDWLKLKYKDNNTTKNLFVDYIKDKGVQFEDNVVQYISKHINHVVSISSEITSETVSHAIDMIKAGVPIIHSVPFINEKNKTKGVIDLLVRNDFLHKFTKNNSIIEMNEGSHFYYVIDIKFTKLMLCSNGKHIMNTGSFPYYKSQLYIYTQALNEIQQTNVSHAFIMGNGYKYKSGKVLYQSNSFLDTLGEVSFNTRDYYVKDKTKSALKWLRDVNIHWKEWDVNPPSVEELYPNMKVDSGIWNKYKKTIATNLFEITSVYQLSLKHRQNAFNNGIRKWSDKRLTSKLLGISGQIAKQIDNILNINRSDDVIFYPSKINTNMYNWKEEYDNDLYVDFETFSSVFSEFDTLPEYNSSNMIFMIGVGRKVNGEWVYKDFTCDTVSKNEEFRIMKEFNDYINLLDLPRMFYWSAEYNIWSNAIKRHSDKGCGNWLYNSRWCDLLTIFKKECISVNGAFSYGLKDIVNAMYKHDLINVNLTSECTNGMDAMILAWNYYKQKDDHTMKDIIKYNEFDCKSLYEIIDYIRTNHS